MGVAQSSTLNNDTNSIQTSSVYGDQGDGSIGWWLWTRARDGADGTIGAKADAAVSGGATPGSMIALLKGLQIALGLSTDASTLTGNGNAIQLLKAIRDLQAGAVSNATTTAYASSLVVKAAPGILYGLSGFNSAATDQFIHLYDSTTLPANGVAPKTLIKVPTASNFSVDFGRSGRSFATGIVIGNSSTGPIKNIGSADCWFDVQYK